ncbi:MAG: hypothetical protein JW741_23645 [Sedimentisphaerales bacterium]|nr:hypothetical protein [Sedimentisphaerales bacterium]
MKNEDVYRHWQQSHRQVATSPDFCRQVMERVARRAGQHAVPKPVRMLLLERVSVRPWARAAAIAVAALIGIGRILLTLHVLLFA